MFMGKLTGWALLCGLVLCTSVWAQEAKPALPPAGKLASFETDADNPFIINVGTISRVAKNATDGQYSLRVEIKGAEGTFWPGLWLWPKADRNWTGRKALVMDIFVETPDAFELRTQLQAEPYKENAQSTLGTMHPGWNKGVTLNLGDFGWADLSRVTSLALFLAGPRRDIVYYVDNMRWEMEPPMTGPGALGWLNVRDFGASGSDYETTATTTEGSNQITVAEVGDFKVGQGVTVSRCNIRYVQPTLSGPGEPYSTSRKLGDAMEIRGYDGTAGSWLTYILEVDGPGPTFRWKDELAKPWKGTKVPITFDWQKLSAGMEVKFKQQEWVPGNMVTFAARDQLVSTITRIEGKTLTLAQVPNRSATDAVVRHTDRDAIQATINRALKLKQNVFCPAGRYRIPGGLQIRKASALCFEGSSGQDTVLDISDGDGSCLGIYGCTEVTVRNLRMVGHTGLADAPLSFTTSSNYGYWPNGLKGCNAVGMSENERVLIENVHVARMSNEAFYAQGPVREGSKEPPLYQKSLTYLRCSVTDCAANAFNNNDRGENTSILYCRVDGAGWHAAEMPARFLRVIGSYFRNCGAITVGDMSHRFEDLHELGCGQAFVSNNVFEGIGRCGGVYVGHGSGQVVISNNLFINFNGNAITVSSATVRPTIPWFKPDAQLDWGSFPSRSVIASGNIIDLTYTGDDARYRSGFVVDGNEVTISDNQVYVRGKVDPKVTGITLRDPALNVDIHDNLIRNCGTGLTTGRVMSRVTAMIDPTTFMESSLPLEWRFSHLYRDWNVVWLDKGAVVGTSVLDSYDPSTLRFKLKAPRTLKVGDVFEVYPPAGANWNIHNNTITGCPIPVRLDSYGSETSRLAGNVISRGEATGVKFAVEVRGRFKFLNNTFHGFDEPTGAVLGLFPDRMGRPLPNLYRDNIFEQCSAVVGESEKGLWEAAMKSGNLFLNCAAAPKP
jgi:hypothetical protein